MKKVSIKRLRECENPYLPLENNRYLKKEGIIGIFDLDNTSVSKRTQAFLTRSEKEGQVVPCDDLPKAFVLTAEYGLHRVYLTPLNTSTLEKRIK